MDPRHFDALVRSLAASRRGLLAGLLGALVATLPDRSGEAAAAGAKRRRRRIRRRCARAGKECGGRCGSCRGGRSCCAGRCVDTATDPRHCGRCSTRCQLNAVCAGGTCDCVEEGCGIEDASCCPAEAAGICACVDSDDPTPIITDPATCTFIPLAECPQERRCVGPRCRACCPVGTTCDPGTGTCLQ